MQKDFQNIRRLTLAATKNDGAYYYFARRLHINENTLTLYYDDSLRPAAQADSPYRAVIEKTAADNCFQYEIRSIFTREAAAKPMPPARSMDE